MRLRRGDTLMQPCMLLIALKESLETLRHWQDLKVSNEVMMRLRQGDTGKI